VLPTAPAHGKHAPFFFWTILRPQFNLDRLLAKGVNLDPFLNCGMPTYHGSVNISHLYAHMVLRAAPAFSPNDPSSSCRLPLFLWATERYKSPRATLDKWTVSTLLPAMASGSNHRRMAHAHVVG